MRNYREPTCANFLREPYVLGVTLVPLLILIFIVATLQVLGLTYVALVVAILGYAALRFLTRYGRNGAEEALIYFFEKRVSKPKPEIKQMLPCRLLSPDTLDEEAQIYEKNLLEEEIRSVRKGECRRLVVSIGCKGAKLVG